MSISPDDYAFDLEEALAAVVGVTTKIPADAMTADVLGTERAGHGVLIDRGLVLTIGYLVTEAQEVWLSYGDGASVRGDVLGYDQVTGFGLIQALGQLPIKPLTIGSSERAKVGDHVVVAGAGGVSEAISARLVAKQEFCGYWEYMLDEALFTAPSHPNWGGTAVLDSDGGLIGVGSLQIQNAEVNGETSDINMVVPIDLLKPIVDDLRSTGQADRVPRPWLGLYATETDDHVVTIGVSGDGPADAAGVQPGDVIVAVGADEVTTLGDFYRAVWNVGDAGVDVILSLVREGRMRQAIVTSADRSKLLKRPVMH
ncbi:MAG: S1C family serine protease [Pseudomonadota bacterium]